MKFINQFNNFDHKVRHLLFYIKYGTMTSLFHHFSHVEKEEGR